MLSRFLVLLMSKSQTIMHSISSKPRISSFRKNTPENTIYDDWYLLLDGLGNARWWVSWSLTEHKGKEEEQRKNSRRVEKGGRMNISNEALVPYQLHHKFCRAYSILIPKLVLRGSFPLPSLAFIVNHADMVHNKGKGRTNNLALWVRTLNRRHTMGSLILDIVLYLSGRPFWSHRAFLAIIQTYLSI